jgi:hypothetical protein
MSNKIRKIVFYELTLPLNAQEEENDDTVQQSPQELLNALQYGMSLTPADRIKKIKRESRAYHIEHFRQDRKYKEYELIFISGQYEHCPPIYDVDTAESKPSTKTLREAEKEASHAVLKIVEDHAYLLLEERRLGISIAGVASYLKWIVGRYCESQGRILNYDIKWAILPKGKFEEEYKKLKRVSLATLQMNAIPICSDALEYSGSIKEMKEEVEIVLRSKRGQSIRDIVASKIPWLAREDKKRILRMRVVGYDEHNHKNILDTDFMKRMEEIEVSLNPITGTVMKPEELFNAMKRLLRIL